MSPAPPPSDKQIEQWVREALARREQHVDAEAIVAGARVRLAHDGQTASTRPWSRTRRIAVRVAIAAAIVAAILLSLPFLPGPVSAETLVQQALLEVKQRPIDRCYEIDAAWTGPVENELLLQLPNHSLLWTRGDRFVVEFAMPKSSSKAKAKPGAATPQVETKELVRWGRDENGQIWFASGPSVGIRFDPKELLGSKFGIEKVRIFCELYAMNSETLLNDVLVNYNLQWETRLNTDSGHEVDVVNALARRKPGANSQQQLAIKKARLELDSKTRMLRRVTLHRKSNTVTFTLTDAQSTKPDSYYHLQSYLTPEAQRRLDTQDGLTQRLKGLIEALKKPR